MTEWARPARGATTTRQENVRHTDRAPFGVCDVTLSDNDSAPLPSFASSGGDILAARACAAALLARSPAPPALTGQARLILTAACLHVQARIGPDPTVGELRELLVALSSGATAWSALASSPIQFVQYAAAEFGDAADGALSAINLAIQALAYCGL